MDKTGEGRFPYGRVLSCIASAAIGARLMYLFDPDSGTRRRRHIQDKATHFFRMSANAADKSLRDLGNRTRGAVAEAVSAVKRDDVSDEVLVERVRAKLGRLVSHPNLIDVTASHGRITLSGLILEREMERLIPHLYSVRGVRYIENRLDARKEVGRTPSLQGKEELRGPLPEFQQKRWSPTARIIAGSAGITALRFAWTAGSLGIPLALAGGGVLLRAFTNRPVRGALGMTDSRRGIELEKTMEIHAPVERVYELWSNPESLPKVMSHVKEVRKIGDETYHWTVSGPAGVSVSWDATITSRIPNRILAWESIPGATVQNAGIVRFDPTPNGGTRVHLRISYNPVGGVVSHALASLFGANPKHALDEDFVRLKSFLEEGKTTVHGQTVTSQALHT